MVNPFEQYVNELDPISPHEEGLWFPYPLAPNRRWLSEEAIEQARAKIHRQMQEAMERLIAKMADDLDVKIVGDSEDKDE